MVLVLSAPHPSPPKSKKDYGWHHSFLRCVETPVPQINVTMEDSVSLMCQYHMVQGACVSQDILEPDVKLMSTSV